VLEERNMADDDDDDDEDGDSPATRLTAKILKFLLKGFETKEKITRYRVVQISAEVVRHLGELE
jgi:condensin complex subunit 3